MKTKYFPEINISNTIILHKNSDNDLHKICKENERNEELIPTRVHIPKVAKLQNRRLP